MLCSGRVDVRRHEPQRAPALSASPLFLTHTRAPCAALAAVSQPPVPAATVAHTAPRLHVPRQVRCAAGRAGGGSGVAAAAAATPSPSRLAGLWQKLLLMGSLFFFMAYNNALLDSLKDTLTVTALGGAEQIPFLTVWAVLPCSILFVLGFSALSTRLPRRTLFNATLGLFLGFYAVFTYILFPLRAQLAPTELTNALMAVMPVGLHGGVAVRFYPRPGHSLPLHTYNAGAGADPHGPCLPHSPQLADAVQAVAATMRRAHAYGDGFGTSFGHLAYAPPRHQLSDALSAELATAENMAARLRRKGLVSQPRRATSPSVAARAGGAARRPTL